MSSSIFQKILQEAINDGQLFRGTTKGEKEQAEKWLKDKTIKLAKKVTPKTILGNKERLQRTIEIGRMYFFKYDPKTKDTLPYYDTFPLIFPIKIFPGGFLGINFHYLPLNLRARLMDALTNIQNNENLDESTKLIISYDILNSAIKFKYFRPTIKKYLNKHVKSNFIRIESNEWEIALFLPVERFKKASKTEVWNNSRKQLRKQ